MLLVWLDWGRSLQLAGLSGTRGHSSLTLVTIVTPLTGSGQPSQTGSLSPIFLQLGLRPSLSIFLFLSPFLRDENKKMGENNDCTLSKTSVSTGALACCCLMCQLCCYDNFFSDVTYFETLFLQQYLLLLANLLPCALSQEEREEGMCRCTYIWKNVHWNKKRYYFVNRSCFILFGFFILFGLFSFLS